ncbi:DUF3263 domain-containing protein [uncultured Jatrophihabitans sp.]|uniref:DUF3263 domain-containing protein n=1 Tax=uncultured Jatrophihabitans sp. TaxID=1610747 RepID=UPI0035CA6027
MQLPDVDREILRLAGARYNHEGHRVVAAYDRFGLSETAFWQQVNRLVDDPAAELAEPEIVHRLRRLRDLRRGRRRAA